MMNRFRVWSAPVVLALMTSVGLADEGSVSTKEMDARVEKSIYQTINLGVQVYNSRDAAGCYRIYQGSLIALQPTLAYKPELQMMVQNGLAAAESMPTVDQRAFALRGVLDDLRARLLPTKSLWSRLGGEPAVKAVVHAFVIKTASNPKVDFTRGGKYPIDAAGVAHLEETLVQLISATTGGPLKYTGKDMKSSHAGMGITSAQFGAMAGDLIAVLKSFKVPQKEIDELVTIVASTKGDIVEESAVPTTDPKSLWSRLGGEPAVKAVVHDFVIKTAGNPAVDFTRGGKYPIDAAGVAHIEETLVQLISANTGGPLKYMGKDMKSSHAGMGITTAQFGAMAADLIEVLQTYKVPQKEIDELIAIVATTKDAIVEVP